MGEHIVGRSRGGSLPAYEADTKRPAEVSSADAGTRSRGFPPMRVNRRGHALGITALLLCTAAASLPLWSRIRSQIQVRLPEAPEGAVEIGTAIGWSTAALANMATVGVLGVILGVVGALVVRWTAPTSDFTRARRTFTVAWVAFVLVKLAGWSLVMPLLLRGEAADAVPALTRPDPWLLVLFAALLGAGRSVADVAWPRAVAVAASLTALYAGTLLLLPA
ncbi:hypothetical protein NLX86_15265 [Streptomyces sp. A3M-1-3]|uniref:hypothetical protein n=1 Tax=Streptomyces sp. A3M-1-3 TaxID=2962044 RepID=UPI0020B6984D|nr:hypothetical protein [Streptomyces sp. A3M-1-3]MCP3819416.1 hypothetical protein [Streptomyces sp. A3M-1-3]